MLIFSSSFETAEINTDGFAASPGGSTTPPERNMIAEAAFGISVVGSLNPGSFNSARRMPTLGYRRRSPVVLPGSGSHGAGLRSRARNQNHQPHSSESSNQAIGCQPREIAGRFFWEFGWSETPVTSTRPPTTLAESIFGGLMSREAMASNATPQGRIDQLNLSDDDCIQKPPL
jgi:hypothetical protein